MSRSLVEESRHGKTRARRLVVCWWSLMACSIAGTVVAQDIDGGPREPIFQVNPEFPVVADVFCFCLSNDKPHVGIEWSEPRRFEFESIQLVAILPGDPNRDFLPIHEAIPPGVGSAQILDFPPGKFIRIGVSFRRGDEISIPHFCAIQCPQEESPPLDVKVTPEFSKTVMQPPGRPVEFVIDGTPSLDFEGGRNLEYFWEIDESARGVVGILDPRSAIARVLIRPLPENFPEFIVRLRLRVIARAGFERPAAEGFGEFEVLVVRAGVEHEGFKEIRPVPVHPIFQRTLANPPLGIRNQRRHRLRFQINLASGTPFPQFFLREGPEGLTVDPETGRVDWAPRFDQAGREHPVFVEIVRRDLDGVVLRARSEFTIAVFPPTTPTALYQLGGDEPGGGVGVGGVQEVLGPAPKFVPDRTNVNIPFDLNLNIPSDVSECAVQLVNRIRDPDNPDNPDGEQLVSTVRFDPEICRIDNGGGGGGAGGDGGGAGPGSSTGGGAYYTSGSAGACLAQEMIDSDELTIELWVSNVSSTQPGAAFGVPAHIFSLSKTPTEFNWRIGVEEVPAGDAQRFVAEVNTSMGVVRLEFDADLSDTLDHQIVLTRRHEVGGMPAKHRLFIDGVEVAKTDAPGDLSVFSTAHSIYIGSAASGANPYTGDISTCGTYAEPLSDTMIDFLWMLGPSDPAAGQVDDPTAAICPDPQEIGRTDWNVDGTDSESGIGSGGGGGGAGVVTCSGLLEFLYPFEWSVSPHAGVVITPAAGYESCNGVVNITFPPPESPIARGTKRYDVTLVVKQVPVRGGGIRTSVPVTKRVVIHESFRRGDSNQDGTIDVSDPVATLLFLFESPTPPMPCRKAADFNNDEVIDVSDPVAELNYIFQGGAPPPPPGLTGCGYDDGGIFPAVALTCLRYDSCP